MIKRAITIAFILFLNATVALAQSPEDYEFATSVTMTNISGVDKEGLLRIDVDAAQMVSDGFINSAGTRLLCTRGLSTIRDCFPADMTASDKWFWVDVEDLPDNTQQTFTLYSGNDAESPINSDGIFSNGKEINRFRLQTSETLLDTPPSDFPSQLMIQIDIEQKGCGLTLSQQTVSGSPAQHHGYSLLVGGTEDTITESTSFSANTADFLYYSITPSQDTFLCGVTRPLGGSVRRDISDVLIVDDSTDSVIATYSGTGTIQTHDIINKNGDWVMLSTPAFLTANQEYHVLVKCTGVSGTCGHTTDDIFNSTIVASYEIKGSLGQQTIAGQTAFPMNIFGLTNRNFLGMWHTGTTSSPCNSTTPCEMIATINDTSIFYDEYIGFRNEYFLVYEDPDFTLFEGGVGFPFAVASGQDAGGIQNFNANIFGFYPKGRYFELAYYDNLAVENGAPSSIADILWDINGSTLQLEQEGVSPNFDYFYQVPSTTLGNNPARIIFRTNTSGMTIVVDDTTANEFSGVVAPTTPDYLERLARLVNATDDESKTFMTVIFLIVFVMLSAVLKLPVQFAMLLSGMVGMAAGFIGFLPPIAIIVGVLIVGLAILIIVMAGNGETE